MQLEEWCTELKTHQSELRVAGAAAAGLKGSCISEELAVGADALGSLMLLGHDSEVCVKGTTIAQSPQHLKYTVDPSWHNHLACRDTTSPACACVG